MTLEVFLIGGFVGLCILAYMYPSAVDWDYWGPRMLALAVLVWALRIYFGGPLFGS